MINSFQGNYHFLSNFYSCPVTWDGITYQNNEAAFQSAKVLDKNIRQTFANLNPSDAKRKGRHVVLRPDWEDVKYEIMYDIVFAKFSQNDTLKQKLLDTHNQHLEEGNTWGDMVWGTVHGVGENHLGKILMRVRKVLQDQARSGQV